MDIESRVLHWDKKYFYMEHRFLVQGELHASCLARIAVLKKGRLQSLGNMMQAVARWHNEQAGELESPQAPQEVVAKIALLSAKKEAAQNRLLS